MRDTRDRKFWSRKADELDAVTCSWCEAAVPLPAEDESGVCIECGAVSFRGCDNRVAALSPTHRFRDVPTPA